MTTREKRAETQRKYYVNSRGKRDAARLKLIAYKERTGCLNPDCPCPKLKSHQLDFHHIDPTTKTFSIALNHTTRTTSLISEIAKCTLVCANCHRDITFGKIDSSKLPFCPKFE